MKSLIPVLTLVTRVASPPRIGMRQIWVLPSRVEMKAMTLPSGDHRPARSFPWPPVACQDSPVATSASQIRVEVRFSSSDGVDSVKDTCEPSGESWRSPMIGVVMKSSMEIGAFSWAWLTPALRPKMRTITSRVRRIRR